MSNAIRAILPCPWRPSVSCHTAESLAPPNRRATPSVIICPPSYPPPSRQGTTLHEPWPSYAPPGSTACGYASPSFTVSLFGQVLGVSTSPPDVLSYVDFSMDNSVDDNDDCSENSSLIHRTTVAGASVEERDLQVRIPKTSDCSRHQKTKVVCSAESTVTRRNAILIR